MRIFNAFFGAMMVPLSYLTAVQLKMSLKASLLTATMVLLGTVKSYFSIASHSFLIILIVR